MTKYTVIVDEDTINDTQWLLNLLQRCMPFSFEKCVKLYEDGIYTDIQKFMERTQ